MAMKHKPSKTFNIPMPYGHITVRANRVTRAVDRAVESVHRGQRNVQTWLRRRF